MEKGVAWPVALGVVNVVLNYLGHRAATSGQTVADAIRTPAFGGAFFTGLVSLYCLMAMYKSGYSLPKGILIAGATSILAGTLVTAALTRSFKTLNGYEWLLWVSIAIFYGLRWLNVPQQ